MSAERRLVVVVQARTSSSRLPAKALLPVGGVPLALLAARRAGRDGLEVRLATSADPSDDELSRLAAEAGLDVRRGPLHDPLARFVEATSDLADSDLVARLTGDNPFPDADLVRALAGELERRGLRYLRAASPESGLPYGVSAEVFDAGALRMAMREASGGFEREHVTPAIRRLTRDAIFEGAAARAPHLRATVDTLSDYLRAARVFARVSDPVGVTCDELTRRLAALPGAPRARLARTARAPSLSELVLGTAQLGMPYGVANRGGMPSDAQVADILEAACAHGVTHLDTARAYGEAERRIGRSLSAADPAALSVVTKLRPLDDGLRRSPREWALEAERSVLESLVALGRESLDTLLAHRASDLSLGEGAVLERLLELRDRGIVGSLGVSVQRADEALDALEQPALTHVQLPMNLLDGRFDAVARARWSRPDVIVVARSTLLQGLLSREVPPERFPVNAGIDPHALFDAMDALVADLGRESWTDLAFSFVRGERWIDALVLGVESVEQLVDAARLFTLPALDDDERALVRARLPECSEALLDPSRWSLGAASRSSGDRP